MAYGCVRTDNMAGTDIGNAMVSFKYQPSSVDTVIENGNVVKVGAYIEGQREVCTASTPAVNSDLATIALVASEELVKSKNNNTLSEFRNEAGDICRGYFLRAGDEFSITAECFAEGSVKTVGSVVELDAGTKLKGVASLTSGSTQVGKIIAVEGSWYVIKVIPAELDMESYSTTETTNAKIAADIGAALEDYSTTTETGTAIDTAIATAFPNADTLATIPVPTEGDGGKVVKVNVAEDGYELGEDETSAT